jgi:hypothetical protein
MAPGYTAIADGRGTTDCNGHGTHVAGTAAGAIYGVAKRATVIPVRVLGCNGSGTNSGVIAGVDWVTANHVKPAVANMSLGGAASSALDTAVNNSINRGVTYAVAAGNSSAVACNYSPARVANALTVGATTSADGRSSFSNYGTCLDIFAPGSSITSAWYTGNSATASLNGTSMASPHVAGAAALYLQTNPGAAPSTVRTALVNAATSGRVSNAGTGSPNLLLYSASIGATGPTPTPLPPTATPVAPTPTPRPTATPVGTPVACSERVANGGFESGAVSWTQTSSRSQAQICTGSSCGAPPVAPRTGAWMVWQGGTDGEAGEVRQTISLPAGQAATLTYWYFVDSSDYCGYDYAYTRIIDGSTTIQLRRFSLCTTSETVGWVKDTVSLNSYAGKTVTLVFRTTTDSSFRSSFLVDDISVKSGSSCVTAAGEVETASAPFDVPEGAQPGKPTGPDTAAGR